MVRSQAVRRGVIMPLVVVALVALMGCAALAIDVARLAWGAQRTQDLADAAALAAAGEVTDHTVATQGASSIVSANNENFPNAQVSFSPPNDIQFYAPGSALPDYGQLGPVTYGVRVTTHLELPYVFARIFRMNTASISRSATALRIPPKGVPFAPMWIDYSTEYKYGQVQQLKMASGPSTGTPGNFGWVMPVTGQGDFDLLLRGYNVPENIAAVNYASVGDTVTGLTGQDTGQAKVAIESSNDNTARLERAMKVPFASDTLENYHQNNPRIMIVPMVEYLGGTGTGVSYQIRAFGAFWLDSAHFAGSNSYMWGRFIQYSRPGVGGDPTQASQDPIWTLQLVK